MRQEESVSNEIERMEVILSVFVRQSVESKNVGAVVSSCAVGKKCFLLACLPLKAF